MYSYRFSKQVIMMLVAFYSALITFLILFIITLIFLVRFITRKEATASHILALVSLLLLTGIISGIYGFDFLKLQAGELQLAQGDCLIEFNENGRSIATTTVEINGKTYQIKGDTYNHLPDGNYQCKVHYLPVTKIIESIHIDK